MERVEREEGEKKCHTFQCSLGPLKIKLNPVVTILSGLIIWGVVAWAIIQPEPAKVELSSWMKWVTKTWTWLYIGTQDIWAVFIVVLFFSKYANVKLGKPDEKPEYGDVTYFVMLFAAGVGIGLFYFGVAEPIWHYEPGENGNRYWGRYSIHFTLCSNVGRWSESKHYTITRGECKAAGDFSFVRWTLSHRYVTLFRFGSE